VTDIATDPLWADYRDIALPHGLRACWSTPIFDEGHEVLGTFAIYHLATGAPTAEEIARDQHHHGACFPRNPMVAKARRICSGERSETAPKPN
jgi:hypothetical protein